MTLAIERSPGSAHRDANKAPCGAGEQHNNRTKREGVSRCSHLPLGPLRRPQASSNTYPNGLTPRQQQRRASAFVPRCTKGNEAMRKKRITRHNGKPVKDAAPVLDPSLENLAAVLEQIAGMDALPLASTPPPRRRRRRCAT
jgi:hypothetical protein